MMKRVAMAALVLALGACSTQPKPLVPVTDRGPATYVCYSPLLSEPAEVRTTAEQQCARYGLGVAGLLGQSWTPLRCGALTPNVAAFQCGAPGSLLVP